MEYRKILPRDLNPRLVPKVPGGVPYVWVLKGAEDSVGHDTLLRYYEDVRASMHIKRVNEFYEVVDEVEVIYRERYSDDLPQAIGPDHVNRMFKDLHPELDWHLRNEGTHILLSRFRLKKG